MQSSNQQKTVAPPVDVGNGTPNGAGPTPVDVTTTVADDRTLDDGRDEILHTGFLKEWTLMLHGTRDPPYGQLSVRDPHSKLAIVKKAHTIAMPPEMKQQQSAY